MPKLVFYTVFIFAFLIGGAIFLLNVFPFRLFYLAALAYIVIPFYGIRIGAVEKVFLVFLAEITISAVLNHVTLGQYLSFLRFIGIPYAMYYLCKNYINEGNIRNIIRICILVACIQPPLVFIQQTFFEPINAILPAATRYDESERMDFSFGSFYISNDPALSFFLMGLIIFLLFDNYNNRFIKYRLPLAGYFTVGVLLSNSQLSNILVMMIWVFYFLRRFSFRDLARATLIVSVAILIILSLGLYDFLQWKITHALQEASVERIQNSTLSNFEEGKYDRTAAVYFYATQPLKIFGDGPSVYYDALNREFTLGNNGQIFTLYAEVGIIGLLIGFWIFYVISRRHTASRPMANGCFVILSLLAITTFVLSDASLMLAYCIFLKTNLVSSGEAVIEEESPPQAALAV